MVSLKKRLKKHSSKSRLFYTSSPKAIKTESQRISGNTCAILCVCGQKKTKSPMVQNTTFTKTASKFMLQSIRACKRMPKKPLRNTFLTFSRNLTANKRPTKTHLLYASTKKKQKNY